MSANHIARWGGTHWSALDSGMNGGVAALAVDGSGNLYAGGHFGTAGHKVSVYFSHWIDPDVVSTEPPAGLPDRLALEQNYPNPFNASTTFTFELPEPAETRLVIYDALGRVVATVVSQRLQAGRFEYVWDAAHLPSGVYFYRLEAGNHSAVRRL